MSTERLQQFLKGRGFYSGAIDGKWGSGTQGGLEYMADLAEAERTRRQMKAELAVRPQRGSIAPLVAKDYSDAAGMLDGDLAKIQAVKAVESGGGWFTDVRKSILDLDGPGGFLDGPDLPKILFEAHLFSAETSGKYDATHPDISCRRWNRKLYVGGEAEYARLHKAMLLAPEAALRSASWGMFQILGRNHKVAGYASVSAFVEAMKASEREHLLAFVNFIKNTPGLLAKYRKISGDPETCRPFCAAYNGEGYATHNYHGRTAAEYRRARAA